MGKRSRLFPFPPFFLKLAGRLTGNAAIVARLTSSLEVQAGSNSTHWQWQPPFEFKDSIGRTVDWYLAEQASTERLTSR